MTTNRVRHCGNVGWIGIMSNVFLYDLFLVYKMPSFGGLYFTRGNLGRLPLSRKKKKKLVVPLGKQMERLTPREIFRKKRTTFEGCLFFPMLPKRLELSVTFVCTTRIRRLCEDYITSLGGHWPPHQFVPRLLRHWEMDS